MARILANGGVAVIEAAVHELSTQNIPQNQLVEELKKFDRRRSGKNCN